MVILITESGLLVEIGDITCIVHVMFDRALTSLISAAAGMMDLHSVPCCIPTCLSAFHTMI